ncbi:ribose transport system ATP-binding protein [Orenia metallireducens]|uniref:Ribose transport system ATP-binding protein n=1 Tax=Orenia metallireducens TaxID=1413210 RepID=A0A285I7C5_9FIRM|nr:histidine kinase dimerization/phosphoacceptor domain -containing protein [Orenia metallireducens]PRX22371.1 ribose transport system ATP-binding protein [Orenia metallireducens]SNY43892.1 ribose transport system ATP-binding protein [Orenia metallireducens]
MNRSILKINNLSSSNSEGYSIEKINLDLNYGEVHSLVVENESISELFIKTLATYLRGESLAEIFAELPLEEVEGELNFKGKLISEEHKHKLSEIGFLLKKFPLTNSFSIAENLFDLNYPTTRWFNFIDWKEINKRAKAILTSFNFGLDHKAKVSTLSTEEKKLVAIAKVFLTEPEVLIINEMTDKLGSDSTSKVYEIIHNYKKSGGSILYITKSWEEALKISDRISILSNSKIKGTLSAAEAKKCPQKLLNMLVDYNYREVEASSSDEREVLDAVFKAAEFLTSEYELKDVLLLLAKEVSKVMNADGCIINLIDESTGTVIDSLEFKIKKDLEATLKKKSILNISKEDNFYYSNANDKEFYSLFKKINQVRTIICIPLLIRSHVSGIIQIFYEGFYLHSEEEAKYLSAFARQAALAIEDTRLMGRSALLQESHHRIKNNLQAIVNLISLQKIFISKNSDKSIDDILDNIILRIKSIATVHDILSKDKFGRSITNLKTLIKIIVRFINLDKKVEVNLELDDIFIAYNKASSIALIVNELVSNSIEHAFANGEACTLDIKCKRLEEVILLVIKDNGVGIPQDFNLAKLNSLGLSIVDSIIKNEFKGEIKFSKLEPGTKVIIKLPIKSISLGS